jgi:hypothetical protein
MDYAKTYTEFRNNMVETIINNADTINGSLTNRKLGYVMGAYPDENIEMGNERYALRKCIDPIFIVGIKDDCVIGYPAILDNVYYEDEGLFDINDLTTETLIALCEKI